MKFLAAAVLIIIGSLMSCHEPSDNRFADTVLTVASLVIFGAGTIAMGLIAFGVL